MIHNFGDRLMDLAVVFGLAAGTAGLWALFLGVAVPRAHVHRPRAQQLAVLSAVGMLVCAVAGLSAVSTRVTPLPVLLGTVVGVSAFIGLLPLTGRASPAGRLVLAAGLSLCLLGALFSTRLGAPPRLVVSVVAVAGFALCSRPRTVRLLERPAAHRVVGLLALVCLALPLALGQRVQDAFVQVSLPVLGSVQTQEPGRVLLVVWLAGSLGRRRASLVALDHRFAGIPVPDVRFALHSIMPAVAGVALGVISNDYGPALVVAVVTTVMLAVAGAKRRYFVTAGVGGALACLLVITTVDKVALRLDAMLHPVATDGSPTQVGSGLIALAHGGMFGLGLGRGLPATIPAVRTDMIVAGLGHEIGTAGLLCVVFLVLLVGVGSIEVGRTARKDTELMLAAGLGSLLLVQSLLVMCGVLGLAPLTGMPVPLLSSSGSSLVSAALALGLVLSVAQGTPEGMRAPRALRRRLTAATVGAIVVSTLLGATSVRAAVAPSKQVARALAGDPLTSRLRMLDRGKIRTQDGKVLAITAAADPQRPLALDNAVRRYPGGEEYAALVGQATVLGATSGLERSLADDLACHDPQRLTGHGCPTVTLTLDSHVQGAAARAMSGKTGAVIAVDLKSGAVLAYGSFPATNPAGYGDPTLVPPTEAPEPDRVTGASTFPGSVAKLAVAIAGQAAGIKPLAEPLAAYYVDGGRITSFTGAPCGGHGIPDSLAQSCNPEFARYGADLGAAGLAGETRGLLNQQPTVAGLEVQPSSLVPTNASLFLAAAGGIGMGDAQATPWAISQLTAMVARDGKPLTYHLVDGARDERNPAEQVDSDLVAAVQEGMRLAVTQGTARSVDGLVKLEAAAKTGTADYAPGQNNAWLTAYAPYDSPRFAVTVVVEPGAEKIAGLVGGQDAGPVAAAVLAACFAAAS